ncbi:Uma2 family endonuclease [Streptomyces venezuelae]|uniref:Uma2 family endonuclease n=1 Tax=Streptomyces venezuelae TaxID=54571 RepID=UPI0036633569
MDSLTADGFFALDLPRHAQLINGALVVPEPQSRFHSVSLCVLEQGLRRAVPGRLRVRRQMCVVIGGRDVPEPDLVVVDAPADGDDPCLMSYAARDVLLAVEVVSPDSEDRDQDTKPRKYAAAGIRHYWLVRMDENKRPAVHTYELDPHTGTYVPTGVHHDRLKLAVPFAIDLDLTEYHRL